MPDSMSQKTRIACSCIWLRFAARYLTLKKECEVSFEKCYGQSFEKCFGHADSVHFYNVSCLDKVNSMNIDNDQRNAAFSQLADVYRYVTSCSVHESNACIA